MNSSPIAGIPYSVPRTIFLARYHGYFLSGRFSKLFRYIIKYLKLYIRESVVIKSCNS